ncbi:MAG: DUF6468 domain-containing protein [Rhodospirillales bacterium]|nr:DUF6468 domain-containing protein [Rhodospirillales bacterium]MCW8862815.1 DUF6468 domain-containing protein [Rhodospirillales bacterium]MCW8951102.1 DUF6468 domain-containing protein [Rhodospirillales bacterium]MCW8971085.1 DUF6468 domain-containing protein [Rhodospirillales bacterium]MCW9002898.1 DUF6468 domain-containing protein [Rhodospirillales bacterium]
MGLSLALDVLIALLLAATIWYAVVLNRRLREFREDREKLEALAGSFNDATTKAEASIKKLKGSTDIVGATLGAELEKAESLRDDLAYLVDRGASIADRLEGGIRASRDKPETGPKTTSKTGSRTDMEIGEDGVDTRRSRGGRTDEDAKSEAERELLKALQSVR